MPEPLQPIAPLSASARMSDADWPGVVGQLGPDWRLVVSSDAKRYSLQQRVPDDAGPRWASAGGKSPSTLARIVAKYAATVPGLSALAASLPDDPASAAPQFVAAIQAREAVFAARDVTRPDYARLVGSKSATVRLAVDPDGTAYVVLWSRLALLQADRPQWRVLHRCASLSDLWSWWHGSVGEVVGSGSAGVVRGDGLRPSFDRLVAGLPERAADGVWPYVPPLPGPSASVARNVSEGA